MSSEKGRRFSHLRWKDRPWNINKKAVGQLIDNCEAKTVDGELWVRGSSVMQGYYKMPEETAATLEDGWLKTESSII